LQGADIVKFINLLQLRWYDHVERMQNQQMPNQVTISAVEGTKDRERPCERWRGKIQEDLNVMRIKKTGQRPLGMEEDCIGGQGTQ